MKVRDAVAGIAQSPEYAALVEQSRAVRVLEDDEAWGNFTKSYSAVNDKVTGALVRLTNEATGITTDEFIFTGNGFEMKPGYQYVSPHAMRTFLEIKSAFDRALAKNLPKYWEIARVMEDAKKQDRP